MVLVTDAAGCKDSKAIMVSDAGAAAISVSLVKNVSCYGGSDGAIATNVAGGNNPPYTYLWANGHTNQNISNVQAGPHQLQVTGANGCISNKIILVTEPSKLMLADSIQNASCGASNGAVGVLPVGGTPPYTYMWSTGATSPIVSNVAAGGYSVMVTDNKGCKRSGIGTIVNLGAATAVIDSIVPANCSSGVGSVYISVTGGSPPYTYLWTTGATAQDLIDVPAGNYGVKIFSNGNPCVGAKGAILPPKAPYTPVICIVTVDTVTGKNQCVFVKDSIKNIGLKQYNFYRETTTAGVFQKLGSQPANQPNSWSDISANPLQRAWRYKVTVEDSCGTEAPIGGFHKTIHLAASVGVAGHVNLSWDDYEGFSYSTFVIYRYFSGVWDSLDAVPSTLHTYTDVNTSAPFDNVYYFVGVINTASCVIAGKNPVPMASNLNLSKSNINRFGATTGIKSYAERISSIQLYPNPTTGSFTIKNDSPLASGVKIKNVEVYNVFGELVHQSTGEVINLNAVNGVYFVSIKTEDGVAIKKIVISK